MSNWVVAEAHQKSSSTLRTVRLTTTRHKRESEREKEKARETKEERKREPERDIERQRGGERERQ